MLKKYLYDILVRGSVESGTGRVLRENECKHQTVNRLTRI
jgi:hypothetical protein